MTSIRKRSTITATGVHRKVCHLALLAKKNFYIAHIANRQRNLNPGSPLIDVDCQRILNGRQLWLCMHMEHRRLEFPTTLRCLIRLWPTIVDQKYVIADHDQSSLSHPITTELQALINMWWRVVGQPRAS